MTMNENLADNNGIYDSSRLWTLKDIFKVVAFYFFISFISVPAFLRLANYFFGVSLANNNGGNLALILTSVFVNASVCAFIIYIVCLERSLPLKALGLTFADWQQNVLEGLKKYVIAIPAFILAGVVTTFISAMSDVKPEQQEIARRVMEEDSAQILIFMIVFGAFIAPVIEEVIFRGFLQTALKNRFGRWRAIALSSFFFRLST